MNEARQAYLEGVRHTLQAIRDGAKGWEIDRWLCQLHDWVDGYHDQRPPLKLEKRRRGRKPANLKFRER